MKFKMISEEDVKAVRAARKALTRIAKKAKRLNDAEDAARADPEKDTAPAALANWRMLDEMEALGITESDGSRLSLRIVPSVKADIVL